MKPRDDIALLMELLSLGKALPAGRAEEIAGQWRSASEAPDLPGLLEHQGAELWLYRRLHSLGIASAPQFDQALRQAAHRDTIRGMRIDDEAVAVLTTFRDAGIACVLIKGQARRAAVSLYPWANARASSDVDLLLPADRAQQAWQLLSDSGYTLAVDPTRPYDEHHHLPPVWGERKVAVELHTSSSPFVGAAQAWTRATEDADQVAWSGLTVMVPSATELLWHAMTHAFLHGQEAIDLRHLLVGAAILHSGRPIDWGCIESRIHGKETRDHDTGKLASAAIQIAWLTAAATLAGASLPPPLAGRRGLPVATLLRWRRAVYGAALGMAAQGRLLEEAARAELGLPQSPPPPEAPAWRTARRRTASAAARLCYRGWRLVAST